MSYRGYDIVEEGPGNFVIYHFKSLYARCGSHWDCIVYIDELLSP